MREPVYRLVPGSERILENILSIMDDYGPKPMKDLKPAKKQSTAAEKFQKEHHGRYEDRVPKSRGKVSQVHIHNRAFPKMHDELEKRRSLANPTALAVKQKSDSAKKAERVSRRHKFSKVKRSRKSKSRKQNGRMQSKYKISKSTARRFIPVKRHLKIVEMIDKSCQYTIRHLYADKCAIRSHNDCKIYEQKPENSYEKYNSEKTVLFKSEPEHRQSKTSIDNDIKTDVDSQNPDTSASLSSYHSYFSIDHEPMVQD